MCSTVLKESVLCHTFQNEIKGLTDFKNKNIDILCENISKVYSLFLKEAEIYLSIGINISKVFKNNALVGRYSTISEDSWT